MTKTQMEGVAAAEKRMRQHMRAFTSTHLLESARETTSLCSLALENDGYVEVTALGENAATLHEGLTKAALEDKLMPEQLCKHECWAVLGKPFHFWEAVAALMVRVMCALLNKSKAWAVFDQAPSGSRARVACIREGRSRYTWCGFEFHRRCLATQVLEQVHRVG